jgi:hypothetical protein
MRKTTQQFIKKLVALSLFAFVSLLHLQAETVPYTSTAMVDQIKISIKSGTASSFQPGEGIERSFDGNLSTIYHSTWGVTTFPVTLTYFLEEASDIDFFVYHTRTSGNNGNFRLFDVQVREAGSTAFNTVLTKDLGGASGAWKIYFDEPVKNVDAVRFIVRSGAGDGNGFAAVAEMEFYRMKEGAFDPGTIFTDGSCTAIKEGISREQLTELQNPFYRQLALDIFDEVYATEFRIQDFKAWPHPDDFSRNNRVGRYSLCDNPTGIFVRQGDTVIVFVDEIHDVPVSLTLKNYYLPDGNGYWSNTYYGLSKGANRIIADRDGLFYVFYHSTEKHETVPPVKIHFAYGKVNGYYDAEKHTAADWTRILNNTKYEYFDALGKYTHLSFPTASFKKNAATTGPQLIASYNNMSHMQRTFMGYYSYPNRDPKNRDHLVVMYHSYMYATSYITGYNIGTMDHLTSVSTFRSSPWGPAHEIGHINQHRPLLMWIGLTEVTTNIKSLLVQTNWGNTSRLIQENRYQNAYNEIMIEGKAQAEADIWNKLVSFWQIQLFFNNVLGQSDFYAKLYEGARTRPIGSTHGDHQLQFVRMVVDSAKMDLTEFFEAWNYLKPVDVMVEDYSTARLAITPTQAATTINYIKNKGFEKPSYKIQYITDNNWQLYRNKVQVEEGSAARFGNTFRMSGWKNVVAYEAWQGSKLVAVSQTDQVTFSGEYTESTKVYAIQYDGTRYEVTPDLSISIESPRVSDGENEYWYIVKNMGRETTNNNNNRSFTSMTASTQGALVGANTQPVLNTQRWKLVDLDGKTGIVNQAGLYLGSDFRATTTPFGWSLENVTQQGSAGYRFANYSGTTLSSVAHLATSLSLMNYTPADAASVWQFIAADGFKPSTENEQNNYSITSLRVDAGLLGSTISYDSEGKIGNKLDRKSWRIVNYNATTGACNLINDDGKYLTLSGSTLTTSETPRNFFVYLTSLDGMVGYRIATGNTSGVSMVNLTNTGALNVSTSLSAGSLWMFTPKTITTVDTPSSFEFTAYGVNGKIIVPGVERFDVYTLSGQRIENNSLAAGAYIVKVQNKAIVVML